MSGIFGYFARQGAPLPFEAIDRALGRLKDRGPDGVGRWRGPAVEVAHFMFETTPEAAYEEQPLVDRSSRFVLTADARIDNREALFSILQLRAQHDNVVTDGDLILAAYKKWGYDCPEHLIGDFAFAIFDDARQEVFCARDGMGLRPFCYHVSDETFAFSSEIGALRQIDCVDTGLDEEAVIRYYLANVDPERTFYRGISRLPGGYAMIVGRTRIRKWQYWSIDLEAQLELPSDEAYAEAFREVFFEAVRCRLRSTKPVCTFVSGGLDSSSITCTARSILENQGRLPLRSYSAIFPGIPKERLGKIDEREYLDAISIQNGVEIRRIEADKLNPFVGMDRLLEIIGEPYLGSNLQLSHAILKEARQDGHRVILHGLDGDTAINHGYYRLTSLFQKGAWDTFASEVRALAQRTNAEPDKSLLTKSLQELRRLRKKKDWRSFVRRAETIHKHLKVSRSHLYWKQGLHGALSDLKLALSEYMPSRVKSSSCSLISEARMELVEQVKRSESRDVDRQTPLGLHWNDVRRGIWQHIMEVVNAQGVAHDMEQRAPFFDRRVLEFCISIPYDQKMNNGWTRILLRRAMEGVLPGRVQWRVGKASLGPAWLRGLQTFGATEIDQMLSSNHPVFTSFLRPDRLMKARERLENANTLSELKGDDMKLYSATILHRWFANGRHELEVE